MKEPLIMFDCLCTLL